MANETDIKYVHNFKVSVCLYAGIVWTMLLPFIISDVESAKTQIERTEDFWLWVAFYSFCALLSLFCFYLYFRWKCRIILYDDKFVRIFDAFGIKRTLHIDYSDIERVDQKPVSELFADGKEPMIGATDQLYIYLTNGELIKINWQFLVRHPEPKLDDSIFEEYKAQLLSQTEWEEYRVNKIPRQSVNACFSLKYEIENKITEKLRGQIITGTKNYGDKITGTDPGIG